MVLVRYLNPINQNPVRITKADKYFAKKLDFKDIKSPVKFRAEVMKKHFNKERVKTKEDNEDFKNCTKCWVCDNYYVDNDVKVRDYCHITGKM